jgi:hypothetical protein
MPSATQHTDLLSLKVESLYRGKTVQVCLSSDAISPTTPVADILASEIPVTNGYSRISHTFAVDAGTLVGQEMVMPPIEATFEASGGNLEWRSLFVLLGGRVACIVVEDVPITLSDGNSYKYQITLRERKV